MVSKTIKGQIGDRHQKRSGHTGGNSLAGIRPGAEEGQDHKQKAKEPRTREVWIMGESRMAAHTCCNLVI
jgi:hypothetical protein